MPLTDTLKTAERLRQAGFSDAQARALAQELESTAWTQNQDFKEFVRAELGSLELRMDARFVAIDTKFAETRADLQAALRDQLLKIVMVVIGVVSLAVAIIKLFPGTPP